MSNMSTTTVIAIVAVVAFAIAIVMYMPKHRPHKPRNKFGSAHYRS